MNVKPGPYQPKTHDVSRQQTPIWFDGSVEYVLNNDTGRKSSLTSLELSVLKMSSVGIDYGHIQRMNYNIWPKKVFIITANLPRGKSLLYLCGVIKKDLKVLRLQKESVMDRSEWRAAIKPRRTQKQRVQPIRDGQAR